MKVVVNQSNYLPWKGYFDLIHDADLFIFHDDLSYTKNDWRNRNKIKTVRGTEWLTIPVGINEHRLINEVALPLGSKWASRHLRLLDENYRHAPHFARYMPFLSETLIERDWPNLSSFNQFLITHIAREFLGIVTPMIDSAQFQLKTQKQERVLDLLRAVGATCYLSGPAGKNYLEPTRFVEAGIDLEWKDYSGYPEYSQFNPPFTHAVSVVDLLFQCGAAAADHIWGWRRQPVRSPKA